MRESAEIMNESEESRKEECLQYFQKAPVLRKLLEGFCEKYRSFGSVTGTVCLRNLNSEAIEALEGLMGKNYHGKKSTVISAENVQKALDSSRFGGVSLAELAAMSYQGELKSKRQEKQEDQEAYRRLLEDFLQQEGDSIAGRWLKGIMNHAKEEDMGAYRIQERLLHKKYRDDKNSLERELPIFLDALNRLPVWEGQYEYLPVFAARVSGNPHYFDEGQSGTLLLYYALNAVLELRQEVSANMPAELRHQIFLASGIIRDTMSNDAMIYGIRGHTQKGEHLGLRGFYEQQESVSITLSTILKLTGVSCRESAIYVVENPVVFAKLTENPEVSTMCVNGQPNQAVLQFLDLVAAGGAQIFYNGDFDPEGLLIAQRLKNRYGEKLTFWHYEESDYQQAVSEEILSERRLKMLLGVTSPELLCIAECIRRTGKAGYQENMCMKLM